MIFGMTTFTLVHVAISLIGIATGLVVLYGLIAAERFERWTAIFLTFTVLTSVTGFFFPFHGFTPAIGVGIVSLLILTPTIYAFYAGRLAGLWRLVYVAGATVALYLNVFVLVVQLFAKVPALTALAPTQSEPPFAIAQGTVLLAFILLGILAALRFRPVPALAG